MKTDQLLIKEILLSFNQGFDNNYNYYCCYRHNLRFIDQKKITEKIFGETKISNKKKFIKNKFIQKE